MKQGFSRRQSVVIVNVILERMTRALQRGRRVEFPFGSLVRVKRRFSQEWDAARDWPANRDPYTVAWELDEEGYRLLDSTEEPPKPVSRPSGNGK